MDCGRELFTLATKSDGVFQEFDGKFYVKRTVQTAAELDLLHATTPSLIQKYQTIIQAANHLLIKLSNREAILCESASSSDENASMTIDLRASDTYKQYIAASNESDDYTLPWPPTKTKIDEKLKSDLINLAVDFYSAGELGEAHIEPQIWKKAMAETMVSTTAKLRERKLGGSKIKNRIYTRVDLATAGERISPSPESTLAGEQQVHDGNIFDADVTVGWLCKSLHKQNLSEDWNGAVDSGGAELTPELPWYMPEYDEPYKPSNFEFSNAALKEHLEGHHWLDALQEMLLWTQELV